MYSELLLERNNLALEVTERHPRLQALDDRMREIRVEMRREVAAQIAALRTREEILNRQMGDLLQKNREVPAVELAMQRLQREAKSNDDLLALLKAKHQEALIKESEKIEEVTIVRPATEPEAPVGAETLNTVVVGALLGLSFGLVLAFVQEGKTTTIVNLALTLAQSGQRTLLVGGNLRRPSIHRFFGIEREPGLSDILVGSTAWRDCIRTVADILMGRFEMEDIMAAPGLDNLHIIEAGPVPANPSELLSTPAMAAFLRAVRDEYDIVLIDTPPVLPVTDSAIVAAQADGVIL